MRIFPFSSTSVSVRGFNASLIISRASFYGIKFNAGGTASGNLMLRNSESIYLEGAATIKDNVISEAVDMPTGLGKTSVIPTRAK